ncbi:MAG: ATP-binding protein [Cyanobacteria bacterium P01_E01_bin.6]
MMPVSPEFIQLCQAQFEILSDGLGASLCIVYTTDELSEGGAGKLVPVVAWPEHLMPWAETDLLAWLQKGQWVNNFTPLPESFSDQKPVEHRAEDDQAAMNRQSMLSQPSETSPVQYELNEPRSPLESISNQDSDHDNDGPLRRAIAARYQQSSSNDVRSIAPLSSDSSIPQQHQIALPLAYQGMMVGLLVTERPDRLWTEHEHHQVESIAKTISIAGVFDRRERWLKHRLHSQAQKQLQTPQHDVFDDLIHQFRNPLTALRTFGKLLMRRLPSSDRNFGVAESIVRESDRLQELLQHFKTALDHETPELADWNDPHLSLLQGIVDESTVDPRDDQSDRYSRDEYVPLNPSHSSESLTSDPSVIDVSSSATYLTGHDIAPIPCVLSEVLSPLIDVAWAIAQDQKVHLSVEFATDLPPVLADTKGLQELMSNLIDNAIKYTPSGGRVLIRVPKPSAGRQAVIVADTGLGIPEEDQVHLFERHFRGVQATGDIPGTGLGLAIAHDLVKKMDGHIDVFSPASQSPLLSDWAASTENRPGTAFIVWLRQASA